MPIHFYNVAPIPADPRHTRYLDAGVLRFGIEHRLLNQEELDTAYSGDASASQEIDDNLPDGGVDDQGVSVHVFGANDDYEYIRFDIFDDDPHFHLLPKGNDQQYWVRYQPELLGDMVPWVMNQLRERLPELLVMAAGEHLVSELDGDLIGKRVDELAVLVDEARQALTAR